MINLLPWREHRYRLRLICLTMMILICYSSAIIFMFYQGIGLYQRQQQLILKNPMVKPKENIVAQVLAQRLATAHTIVQARFKFMRALLNKLKQLPASVVLQQLQCHEYNCELKLQTSNFKNIGGKLSDIRQGACPTCYQAIIDLHT